MAFETVQDLLEHQLRDIYSAERQILRAMPRVILAASNRRLITTLEKHRLETEEHVRRLEQCFHYLDDSPRGVLCRGIEGLLEELLADATEEGRSEVRDAGLVAGCQQIAQFQLAMYGTARIFAKGIGEHRIVHLLDRTVADEEGADATLADLAEFEINPAALNQSVSPAHSAERPLPRTDSRGAAHHLRSIPATGRGKTQISLWR